MHSYESEQSEKGKAEAQRRAKKMTKKGEKMRRKNENKLRERLDASAREAVYVKQL